MATLVDEINTIMDYVETLGVSETYKEEAPKVFVANTASIELVSSSPEGLNASYFSTRNTYKLVYYDTSSLSILNFTSSFSEVFGNLLNLKIKLRGLDEYLTIDSFSVSPKFKTDTAGINAIIIILQVKSNIMRDISPGIKMQEVNERYI